MTMTKIDPQQFAEKIASWWAQAAADQRLGERLGLAQTTVHIHFSDDAGITLLLDRQPIGVEGRIVGTAEVEIWGPPELFVAMIRREKQMAMLINDGLLEYRGPVRKFLRIVPIMRAFDFEMWRGVTTGDESAV